MKVKFSELSKIESQPIPLAKKPCSNGDHAVITYINMRNEELNVSVTSEEVEQIEFSKDFRYMQLPPFLVWKKSPKGPYLAHTANTVVAETSAKIDW